MFTNKDWQIIGSDLRGKKIVLFGRSKRNHFIYEFLRKSPVFVIFDNNSALWGTKSNGIEIKKPYYLEDAVVITTVVAYREVVLQMMDLGYHDIYFYMPDDQYLKITEKKLKRIFTRDMFRFIPNDRIKYIHVIPDQKFILPTIDAMEHFFKIEEHLFLIYSLEKSNPDDIYGNWNKCFELKQQYNNIYFVEEFYNIHFYHWNIKLHELDDILDRCLKIIFHGEFLCDEIADYFAEHKDILAKKAIWIPWSGNVGKDDCNAAYIDKALKYVKEVAAKSEFMFQSIDVNCGMKNYKKIDSEISYTWVIQRPFIRKTGNKVLIGHSCYEYNRNLESLKILSRFAGNIEVYCITSYGTPDLIKEVKNLGKSIFKEKFYAVDQFMLYKEYVDFIAQMDVAFFGGSISSGFDTLQLLFWTKAKVYLRKGSEAEKAVCDYEYKVSAYEAAEWQSVEEFLAADEIEFNYQKSLREFDSEIRKAQWEEILT